MFLLFYDCKRQTKNKLEVENKKKETHFFVFLAKLHVEK